MPHHRPAPLSTARLMQAVLGVAVGLGSGTGVAQEKKTGGIYSCVDRQGRRLTSDRPIVDCLDREQKELGHSGTVKRVIPPSYTAEERAQLEARRRAEELEQAHLSEEKRRERALLIRYPNPAMHDKERAEALGQIDNVIDAVRKRVAELGQQRREIDQELEFYQSDPRKAPAWLQRKHEDNAQQVQVQNRILNEQNLEKQRVNARFDEERARLRTLWGK